jgi:hypothetical protein
MKEGEGIEGMKGGERFDGRKLERTLGVAMVGGSCVGGSTCCEG